MEIDGRVAVAELEFAAVVEGAAHEFAFRDVPRFPPVRRDLAFILPESAPAGTVQAALVEAAGPLLDRCVLFDVFRGGSLHEGTKSLAFSLDLRAPDRTLTDREAEEVVRRIVERLESDFRGRLRAG
jgi:phenylalanyl-tRNA synthetase beta chain